MTPRDRHLAKMKEIEKQIEKAKGITHINDLIRQWQNMNKDLIEYDQYMKESSQK